MRSTTYNKVTSFLKVFSGFIIAVPLLIAGTVQAVTMYSTGSMLQPNDVTSSHIRDNAILNIDINSSAAIGIAKIKIGDADGSIPFAGSAGSATSSALTYSTTTSKLTITGSLAVTASTTFNGVEYLFPSIDGTSGQVMTTNGAGGLSYSTVSQPEISTSFTAGETLIIGASVFVASSTSETITSFNPSITSDTYRDLGNVASSTQWAQSFTETKPYDITKVQSRISKQNNPGDSFKVAIQADNAGVPSGIDLASGTKLGSTLSPAETSETITLSSTVTTLANTKYWVVFSRTGALDITNNYAVFGDFTSPSYSNGKAWAYNGSTWADNGPGSFVFLLQATTTVGRVYQTDADENNKTLTFIGTTKTTGVTGGNVTVILGGVATGLSGLTTGATYYVSNTIGAISSTAGTVSKKVGGALSPTTLLIQNTW